MNTTPVYTNEIVLPLIQQLSPAMHQSNPFFIGRLSLPPSLNDSYEIVTIRPKGKKPYQTLAETAALKQFKHDAGWELKNATCDWALVERIRASRYHPPLAARIRVFYPTMWKRDMDNVEKAVQDAVFLHLGLNDTLVCAKNTTKDADKQDPRVEIELRCILSK